MVWLHCRERHAAYDPANSEVAGIRGTEEWAKRHTSTLLANRPRSQTAVIPCDTNGLARVALL
jgi:hypothetical protein